MFPVFSLYPAEKLKEEAAGWMLGSWPGSTHHAQSCISHCKINPKCATRNPVLGSIPSTYKGSSNTFLASKSSWNQTTLDCNGSICHIWTKLRILYTCFFHSSLNTTCTIPYMNTTAPSQSYLSDFQRQQFSTVHPASSTGCMKKQGHQQDNPWARWVINSKQAVTEMSCQHSPSAVVQVQQSHPGSSEPPPRPPGGCAVLGLEDSWPGCVEWIAGAAPVLSYICHKFVLHHL